LFRYVCSNGLVIGDTYSDVRVKHKGDVVDSVIEGAFTVLEEFETVNEQRDSMKSVLLNPAEQRIFAQSALSFRYDEGLIPITEEQILAPRRREDSNGDLWTTFNKVQENIIKGGIPGRNANGRTRTRTIQGIDQNVKLNRALWVLADEMRKLKQ